jgi:glyoxylase I family protein
MNLNKRIQLLLPLSIIVLMLVGSMVSNAQTKEAARIVSITARFEHIAVNVSDPPTVAKWYTDNLGMKVMRAGGAPTFTTFIADSGVHMMMELFHNDQYPLLEPAKIHHMAIHLAFITPNILQSRSQLLAAGATIVDSLKKTSSGDQVMTVRDPWGLPIQFVERVSPMLSFSGMYPEHFAMNVADSRAKAKWYTDNLGMVVVRDGKAPTYGMFVGDAGKHMMYELYQQTQYPAVDFNTISHMSIHVAFMVDDVQTAKDALIKAGAKLVDDVTKTPAGDFVLMLRDPWGQPIQFVKRATPMLK